MKGIILRAVSNGEMLEMIYQDNQGNISQRRVKVLSVNDESFRVFCYSRMKQRTFLMRNVLSIGPARKMGRGA